MPKPFEMSHRERNAASQRHARYMTEKYGNVVVGYLKQEEGYTIAEKMYCKTEHDSCAIGNNFDAQADGYYIPSHSAALKLRDSSHSAFFHFTVVMSYVATWSIVSMYPE